MNGISVVIPSRNRHLQIRNAVASALRIYCVKEIIVVDDGSNPAIELEMFGDLNVPNNILRVTPNAHLSGAQGARKTGALSAKCEIVLFLDSDDLLLEDGVMSVYAALEREEDVAMAYSNVLFGDWPSNFVRINGDGFRMVLKNLSLCPFSGLMIRKSLVPWTSLDLKLPAWQDDDFCLAVCKHRKIIFVDTLSAAIAASADNISGSKQKQLIGLLLLISNWRNDLLAEFGNARLFLWRLRALAIMLFVVSQDFQTAASGNIYKRFAFRVLAKLFMTGGLVLRSTTRPFFDRIYA